MHMFLKVDLKIDYQMCQHGLRVTPRVYPQKHQTSGISNVI